MKSNHTLAISLTAIILLSSNISASNSEWGIVEFGIYLGNSSFDAGNSQYVGENRTVWNTHSPGNSFLGGLRFGPDLAQGYGSSPQLEIPLKITLQHYRKQVHSTLIRIHTVLNIQL